MEKITMAIRPGFGWEPEFPDYRDYKFSEKATNVVSGELPESFSLRQHDSPVRNQGQLGSCTGFALCAVIEMLRRTDSDAYSTIYSPLFAYYYGRVEDGSEWANIDSGAYIRDLAKVAAKIGVCPESRWKYNPRNFAAEPSDSAVKEAARWKSGKYYSLKGVDEIKRAIVSGYGVMFGFSCFSNMFTAAVDGNGVIPLPGGGFEGGHAVKGSGYDARYLDFKNSWGDWGDSGYGRLPWEFIVQGWASDVWAVESEA
jgi:C1A family cysteine protease